MIDILMGHYGVSLFLTLIHCHLYILDDIRGFFFCGTSWGGKICLFVIEHDGAHDIIHNCFLFRHFTDATARCYRRCLSGSHAECPGDEEVR